MDAALFFQILILVVIGLAIGKQLSLLAKNNGLPIQV